MENQPIEVYDEYLKTKDQIILTYHEHGIPGLRMIGIHTTSHAKSPLPMHYHKNCFEFTYLVQGNIQFHSGGQDFPLSGGDLFLTLPNEVHGTGNAPMSLHQMYWFQLEADHPETLLYTSPAVGRWMVEQLNRLTVHVIKMSGNTAEVFREIFDNINSGTEIGRIQAGHMLASLLCQILKDSQLPKIQVTPDIGRAADYIQEHIREKLPLEELAAVSLLSPSRFKQKFKDQIGISPRNYVNFHKIEEAKKMLLSGASATEVAMDLSFSGSDYFSVVFRRYTSFSPTEYVREKQQEPKEPQPFRILDSLSK